MITAVVTHYNKPKGLLERCIGSLEKFGLDYIIVDDASDNKTHLSSYENVVCLPKNVGPFKAFEQGLNLVRTPYVMRVDADDYILGVPDISSGYDAYINNVHRRISLSPEVFAERPYAGLSGIVAKTDVLKAVWTSDIKYCADIIIFNRIIMRYRCKMNDECLYVYDLSGSNVTKMPGRKQYIDEAKKIMKKELQEYQNEQIC